VATRLIISELLCGFAACSFVVFLSTPALAVDLPVVLLPRDGQLSTPVIPASHQPLVPLFGRGKSANPVATPSRHGTTAKGRPAPCQPSIARDQYVWRRSDSGNPPVGILRCSSCKVTQSPECEKVLAARKISVMRACAEPTLPARNHLLTVLLLFVTSSAAAFVTLVPVAKKEGITDSVAARRRWQWSNRRAPLSSTHRPHRGACTYTSLRRATYDEPSFASTSLQAQLRQRSLFTTCTFQLRWLDPDPLPSVCPCWIWALLPAGSPSTRGTPALHGVLLLFACRTRPYSRRMGAWAMLHPLSLVWTR